MSGNNLQYKVFYSKEMDKFLDELAQKNQKSEVIKGLEISMSQRLSGKLAA